MKAIIAVNNLGFIGKDNKLFWRSKEDLQHFKKLTENKILLCGYNTYCTLPNVVLDRTTVFLDTRGEEKHGIVLPDSDSNVIEDIWCIGGKKTYEKYASDFTELHISHINHSGIGDCMFPDLRNLNPDCKIFNYHFEASK